MPHFVIDYARDLERDYDLDKIMQIAFDSGVASAVMQPVDIKVRARPFDHYRLLNTADSFLHVTVFLLAGRTDAQKQHVSLLLRQNLAEYLTDVTSISVDIRDMNSVAYKKRLLSADDT
jgi:5-carboxymethyl-2-hydroxymuconate isomerase